MAFAEQAWWFAELAVAGLPSSAYGKPVQIGRPLSFATGLAGGDLA
ncbi:MAG: hypothetical protein K2W91_03680 [Novosphingobium sp.]|nr:hypothetical protein [Novosphingobium sp.]